MYDFMINRNYNDKFDGHDLYISYSTRRRVCIGTIEHNDNITKLQIERNIIRKIMFSLLFIKIYKN